MEIERERERERQKETERYVILLRHTVKEPRITSEDATTWDILWQVNAAPSSGHWPLRSARRDIVERCPARHCTVPASDAGTGWWARRPTWTSAAERNRTCRSRAVSLSACCCCLSCHRMYTFTRTSVRFCMAGIFPVVTTMGSNWSQHISLVKNTGIAQAQFSKK